MVTDRVFEAVEYKERFLGRVESYVARGNVPSSYIWQPGTTYANVAAVLVGKKRGSCYLATSGKVSSIDIHR